MAVVEVGGGGELGTISVVIVPLPLLLIWCSWELLDGDLNLESVFPSNVELDFTIRLLPLISPLSSSSLQVFQFGGFDVELVVLLPLLRGKLSGLILWYLQIPPLKRTSYKLL